MYNFIFKSMKDITVFHRYTDKTHFLAIDHRVLGYVSCDPVFFIGRALKGKISFRVAFYEIYKIFTAYIKHPRAKIYIYGFAPDSFYFTLLSLIWWRPGRRILFTSFSDRIETTPFFKRYLLRVNLMVAQSVYHAAAAVSMSAHDNLSGYLKTVLVEHSIAVEDYKVHNKTKGLVYLGRIVPYKKVDRIIDAARETGLNLDLIGPIQMNLSILDNLPSNVKYCGVKDSAWIKATLGKYQALVLNSEQREPFGIVLLEAMASGVIVIASHTYGTQTIFRNWPDYPLLFHTNIEGSLAACLKMLINMPDIEIEAIRSRLKQMADSYRSDAIEKNWNSLLT